MAATLAGSTALLTGATSGIGREIALELAQRGAEVVVHGRSAERGAKIVRDIEDAGGKARFVAQTSTTLTMSDGWPTRRDRWTS
jgi:NAD(P)-dependent dehydrogenase (short-subunit alcohol dehydrogenase family)